MQENDDAIRGASRSKSLNVRKSGKFKRGNKGAAEMLHDLRHVQEILADKEESPTA